MKKIVMGIAALACAASIFALDFSATVKMDTDIARGDKDGIDFLSVNKKDQKDNDALIISANTDKAGANFQLWYRYDGTDGTASGAPVVPTADAAIHVRKVSAWFKPLDMLKVTVGDVSMASYKETIFWWHGVYGAKPGSWGAFGGDYLAGVGAVVDLQPVDNLSFQFGIMPGIGNALVSSKKDYGYKGYAVKASYAFDNGSATVIFADKGKDAQKLIGVGAEFGNNWADGFYGFVNVNFNLGMLEQGKESKKSMTLQGISIDNYFKYQTGALKIQTHLPFVLFKAANGKKAAEKGEPVYDFVPGLYATAKVIYALDGISPYFLLSTEPDGDAGWVFGNKDNGNEFKFHITFQPGATFNVGAAAFDIAFRGNIKTDDKNKTVFDWKVPCGITIGL